eukprot:scaffold7446_cov258-Pinguiococcus_pyrenoidosus.AAC.1
MPSAVSAVTLLHLAATSLGIRRSFVHQGHFSCDGQNQKFRATSSPFLWPDSARFREKSASLPLVSVVRAESEDSSSFRVLCPFALPAFLVM